MKVTVFGAGAIGGFMGAKLALAGHDVTLIARGPHLAAMRERGLELRSEGKTSVVRPRCTDDAREAGPQDYVILSVKAHALPGIADAVQPLLGPRTALVPAVNGVPWWYFYKHGGPHEGPLLQRHPQLAPGEVRSETAVHAAAEGEMPVDLSVEADIVTVGELGRIDVRGAHHHRHEAAAQPGPGMHRLPRHRGGGARRDRAHLWEPFRPG